MYLSCSAAAFAAEYVLNYNALNFLLNIEQGSLVSVACALAPAAAVIILEDPLDRLIEGPWRAARSAVDPGKHKLPWILLVGWLLIIAFSNILTIGLLGEARAIALLVLGGDGEGAVNGRLLHVAIRSVSVIVAINGAAFLLHGRREARSCFRLFRAGWKETSLRSQVNALERRKFETNSDLETCLKAREDTVRIESAAEQPSALSKTDPPVLSKSDPGILI